MQNMSPAGVLLRGLVAGAVGAAFQNLFFKTTSKWMPDTPKNVFVPPEPQQKEEGATETVARRFVEKFAERGKLSAKAKGRLGSAVHYGFGADWGAVYALAHASTKKLHTPSGLLLYSTAVWMVSDNLILPTFKLSAWPQKYPLKNHVYAWFAHVAYGVAVWGTYRLLSSDRMTNVRERLEKKDETESLLPREYIRVTG